ncbi:putative toxin-antitoxin system toxin component, PIN family [Microcoleus sp. EPA2]|uniref:putative toxin-antitoxin system toxin component, PIN family n=1 Tax=Microcoleus sp. EPA2 TaxID=2841654 RepID=UPI00312B6F74
MVIDTNLVLSALVFGGRLSRLRLAWQNNRFIPLASEVTISELVRVLTYPKFKLTNSEQEDLLSDYLPFCDTVLMPDTLPVVPECRDPFDIPFLLLAVVGQANYLVTGDGDLLCLSDKFSCPILTVDEFLTVINYQSL